jgi:hypothetical protein
MTAMTSKIVLVVTAGVLLGGCGAPPTTSTSEPGPSGSAPAPSTHDAPTLPTQPAHSTQAAPTKPVEPARSRVLSCVAADVKGAFSEPDQAAGLHGVRIIVTNTSSHPCTIFGYGGLEMFSGGDGRRASTTVSRLPNPGPALVTLKPGDTANKSLTWEAPRTAVGDPDHCTAFIGFVGVTLPDDTRPFTVDGDLGQVCNDGIIDGRAYAAGLA